jgi:hypothetical protein
MALVVILGTAGIVYSRDQRQPDNTRPLPAANGVAGDHWHAALGIDICGTFESNIPDSGTDPLGIHTHGDGVVHIHPFSSTASGKRAKLSVYFDTVNAKISASSIKIPNDDTTHKNGQSCSSGPATVQTKVWDSRDAADQGRIVPGNPADIRPTDGMLITIAFVPTGTDIPRPPSADQLDKLSDVGAQPTDATQDTTTSSTTPADPNATTTTIATGTTPVTPTSTATPTSTVTPTSTATPSTTAAP